MAAPSPHGLARRLRCALRWPPGHLDEFVPYVDPVLGRWRAASRCVRCGRARGLATPAGDGPPLPADPVLLTLPAASLTGGLRARRVRPLGMPDDSPFAAEVLAPDGRLLLVRRVRVVGRRGRVRTLYAASALGADGLAAVSADLADCLARSAGAAARPGWVEATVRQLGDELAVG